MSKSTALMQAQAVRKVFLDVEQELEILHNIHFSIEPGERVAIVGPSGSGQSTLLHLLGGLDVATSGNVVVDGQDWAQMSEKKRCLWRNQTLGFVYQFHHLLPELSALENVMLPLLMQKTSQRTTVERAQMLLTHMGLGARLSHRPHQLSGGERQRVAIARAMVTHPKCILADEPTGNLDQATAQLILDLWNELNQTYQTALVIVTHDLNLARQMDKAYRLERGHLTPISSQTL
jgi:lipoprotein-releasing system ATP-binding protein